MEQIPAPTKERLLYLMRILERMGAGEAITSSRIEALTGWASHTVRKDISFLGAAGNNEGVPLGSSLGYDTTALVSLIKRALNLERRRKFCVVGLGRLGSAYLNAQELEGSEFELVAGFDTNVNRTEILKSTVPLYPAYKMPEVISRFDIEIALLCVPVEAAQTAADRLITSGIRGILNFAPAPLKVPPGIAVQNVYLMDELRALSIKMIPAAEADKTI